jgi:PAS domain S-box-containing protein
MSEETRAKEQLLEDIKKAHSEIDGDAALEIEYKRAEEAQALRESEELYRALFETTNDLILSVAPDGHFLYVNRAWQDLLGYHEEELSTRTIFDILDAQSLPYFLQVLDIVLSNEKLDRLETVLVARDGKKITVEGNIHCEFLNEQPVSIRILFRDITGRKQTEKALRASEQWFAATLKSIGDAVITTDNWGAITFMNPVAEKLTGWKREEALGKDIVFKTTKEETPPSDGSPAQETLQEDIVINIAHDHLLIARDGKEIPIEFSGAPIKDDKGNIDGVVMVIHNITERKRAADALRKAHDTLEKRVQERTAKLAKANEGLRIFQQALQTMQLGVTITDPTGKILYTNPADAALHGYAAEELLGQDVRIFAPPDRRKPMTVAEIETMKGWVRESLNLTSDRKIFPVHLMSGVVRDTDGKPLAIVTSCEDITERKQAERSLSEERNLLRILIDNLPDCVFVKDRESRFLINNLAHVQLLGAATPDEIIGNTIADFVPKELAEHYHAEDQEVFRTGQALLNQEEVDTDPDGNTRWRLMTKVPLRNSQEDIVGLVGISRDITKQKRVEENLHQLDQAVAIMQLGIILADLEGKIIYTNRTGAEMHGYQLDELLGKDIGILTPPVLRKPLTMDQIKAWKGLIRESFHLKKDGNTFPVRLISEIMESAEGEPCGIVTSCEDLTERNARGKQ